MCVVGRMYRLVLTTHDDDDGDINPVRVELSSLRTLIQQLSLLSVVVV